VFSLKGEEIKEEETRELRGSERMKKTVEFKKSC
jgi:hypothetical protein